jgi:hypothetical protein
MNEEIFTIPSNESLFSTEDKNKKKNANFSISVDVLDEFDTYIKSMVGMKKSPIVEKLIVNFLIQSGVREK